jgi:hypothetical protein
METGGEAIAPTPGKDVMNAFTRIAEAIRSGYTIGYSAPDVSRAGFRSVRVVVDAGDGRALTARTRSSYFADRAVHAAP